MLIKNIFLDGVDTQLDIHFPVNCVDVEIQQILLLRGKLVIQIDGFDALTEPLVTKEVFIFLDESDALLLLE